VIAPGVYDGFSAMVARSLGVDAVYVSGYCVAASRWGLPDAGIMGMREMLDGVELIATLVDVPIIADADTGYGGLSNVFQTVREYERAGVAALQIEDQEMPKKCGHTPGKRLVDPSEMAAKVEVAVEARQSADTLIIARTDARAAEGLEAAIARAALYRRAGADVCFVEAPHSVDELRTIRAAVDAPLLVNMVPPAPGFTGLDVSIDELRELGVAIAIYPVTLASVATESMIRAWQDLVSTGRHGASLADPTVPLHQLVGFEPVWEREGRWSARYGEPGWSDDL
jgi:2-methylisocitrate lyase-like PEP mutase family enzyme